MRILFVTNVAEFYITREPLGLAYLSAIAKADGHQTRFCSIHPDQLDLTMRDFQPGAVCFSITTGQHRLFLDLNKALKKRFDFLSLFGGPHATFSPETIEEEGVDGICRGEGERAFADLIDRIDNDKDYENTPNWWIKKEGQIFKNDVRPLEQDIDRLPWPDRQSLFDQFPDTRTTPIKCFVANRGCPFSCTFCFNDRYFELYSGKGKRMRVRDPKALCDEISHIRSVAPLRMPMFTADIFAVSKKWVEEFGEVYREKIGLPYYCNSHANVIDETMARLLAKSGCKCTGFGIESGDDRIRQEVLNRPQSREQIISAARALKKNRITVLAYNIIGIPGTGMETDLQTLELNRECGVDYSAVHTMAPMAGTKIHDLMVEQGLIDPVSINEDYSYHGRSHLPIEDRVKRGRLYYLFALAVSYSTIHKMLPLLLSLPLDSVYRIAFRLFRGWRYKQRAFPIRHGALWTLKAAWRYLTFEHR